ncbi:MAG: gamma-glutamyltransferase, partial [Gammaproteobacteria bacterium]|nr:gamma-glutamyltransferase [Gammaproteobacteria bacterium]
IWQLSDLKNYQLKVREPVTGNYNGIKVTTAAPPSSGGIVLMSMLNILSGYDLDKTEPAQKKHLVVEAMRRAYRDRAIYMGDPDFVQIPTSRLLSKEYTDRLRSSIESTIATPSNTLPGIKTKDSSHHTTHFSILDKSGNRVAATLTINYPFGSGLVAGDSGVLLNDEMDDFSAKPGEPNAYGLIGAEANAIAANKRPLSSMTPTFLETDDRVAILGTPGGSRIITMVLLAALDFKAGNKPDSWVSLSRYHHQYLPDIIFYEPDAISEDEAKTLGAMGHELKKLQSPYGDNQARYGNMQAIMWDKKENKVYAASDPRGEGSASVIK